MKKIAFDFSKVKKAGRARSVNDLYAAGGIPGNGSSEQLYGDSGPRENFIGKLIENTSDPDSKKRRLRATIGDDTPLDASERNKINKIYNFPDSNMLKSEYARDFFNDFVDTSTQLQPVQRPSKDELLKGVRNTGPLMRMKDDIPEKDLERESGLYFGYNDIDKKEQKKFFLGDYPTPEDLKQGIEGSVNMYDPNLNTRELISLHSHPKGTRNTHMYPSNQDMDISSNNENSFVTTLEGHKAQYDTNRINPLWFERDWQFPTRDPEAAQPPPAPMSMKMNDVRKKRMKSINDLYLNSKGK